MALEELTSVIYTKRDNGIAVNVFTDSEVRNGKFRIVQKTQYPFDGSIQLTTNSSGKEEVPLFIRVPDWASNVFTPPDVLGLPPLRAQEPRMPRLRPQLADDALSAYARAAGPGHSGPGPR